MKAGWEVKKLGEVCAFTGSFGGSLKKNIFVDDGYAVYEQRHAIHNEFNAVRYFIEGLDLSSKCDSVVPEEYLKRGSKIKAFSRA